MKLLRTSLGIAVSLLCLWLAVRNVPFADLRVSLSYASTSWLFIAILGQFLSVITRAQRWVVLLGTRTSLMDSFWAQGIGYLFTNILPMRMGEPARVLVMSQRSGLSIMHVAASALIERLFDITAILIVLLFALPFIDLPSYLKISAISILGLAIVAIGLLFIITLFRNTGKIFLSFLCKLLPFLPQDRILHIWMELIDGFSMIYRWHVALQTTAWSMAIWILSILTYWFVLLSIQPNASLLEATFMLASLCLAATIPSSPGFVGVFQWAGQQALVLPFGDKYTLVNALAITLLAHITYYATTTAIGLMGMTQIGTSLMNIRSKLFRGA